MVPFVLGCSRSRICGVVFADCIVRSLFLWLAFRNVDVLDYDSTASMVWNVDLVGVRMIYYCFQAFSLRECVSQWPCEVASIAPIMFMQSYSRLRS